MRRMIVGTFVIVAAFWGCSKNEPLVSPTAANPVLGSNGPVLQRPANGDTGIVRTPRLAWHPVANAVSYRVQVSAVSAFNPVFMDRSAVTDTELTVSGLDGQEMYYWRVNASADGATTEWSAVWQFTTTVTPIMPTAGLIAHYPFNGNANDASGNAHHGTVNGATLTADRFGNAAQAYAFDGLDDYIKVPYSAELYPTDQLTVSAWVKADSWGSYNYSNSVVDCEVPGSHAGYGLRGGATAAGFFVSTGNWQQVYSDAGSIGAGIWYHLVGRYDGASLRLYINGAIVETLTCSGSMVSSNRELRIGTNNSDLRWFDGVIDDVRIYNRALNQTEINALYSESGWKGN